MKPAPLVACLLPLLAFALASVASAAYLESDTGERIPRPVPELPPRILPRPLPERDHPLVDLVQRIEIGQPYSYRGLTAYPLLTRTRGGAADALTLDEALSRGDLDIRERNGGQVPFVEVRNEGRRPVFLLAGEILVGGRQNRVIRDDVLLPARSEFIEVPVYCGEQDRWQGGTTTFKSGATLSAPGLREMAAGGEPQEHIWRAIDGQLRQAEVRSATRSYQAYYEDQGVKDRLDDCVRHFRSCRTRQTVGVVVVGGDRILGADLFADADLCARLWDKILRSYGGDIVLQPKVREWEDRARPRGWFHEIGREEVQRLLDRIRAADFDARDTAGLGRLYRIRGGVTGNVLVQDGEVVHAAVFTGGRE